MINEVNEVQRYLNGEDVDKRNLYRICYLILKWYKENGMDMLEARDALFAWANKNKLYIEYNVNSIISYLWKFDTRKLSDVESVFISKADVNEINRRFDRKRSKLLAFALLCYGKVFADKDGEFSLSLRELEVWTGISKSSISSVHMQELIDFKYIEIVNAKKVYHKHNKTLSFRTRFKLLVPFKDEGDMQATDDITESFTEIFG